MVKVDNNNKDSRISQENIRKKGEKKEKETGFLTNPKTNDYKRVSCGEQFLKIFMLAAWLIAMINTFGKTLGGVRVVRAEQPSFLILPTSGYFDPDSACNLLERKKQHLERKEQHQGNVIQIDEIKRYKTHPSINFNLFNSYFDPDAWNNHE